MQVTLSFGSVQGLASYRLKPDIERILVRDFSQIFRDAWTSIAVSHCTKRGYKWAIEDSNL